jgi:HPt (histidine-containing phosphotransfer) domain-containing protein
MEVPLKLRLNYIERRKVDASACENALQLSDFKTLERVGHQLKGNGATFGFEELAEIGRDLEIAAKAENLKGCTPLVSKLIQAIQGLRA